MRKYVYVITVFSNNFNIIDDEPFQSAFALCSFRFITPFIAIVALNKRRIYFHSRPRTLLPPSGIVPHTTVPSFRLCPSSKPVLAQSLFSPYSSAEDEFFKPAHSTASNLSSINRLSKKIHCPSLFSRYLCSFSSYPSGPQ